MDFFRAGQVPPPMRRKGWLLLLAQYMGYCSQAGQGILMKACSFLGATC